MRIKRIPAGFVIPAQPVKASKPPSGADWVHELKHDGYRLIGRRDGPTVRLYSRNPYDWTERLAAIAAAAELIKANSFTIHGKTILLGSQQLSFYLSGFFFVTTLNWRRHWRQVGLHCAPLRARCCKRGAAAWT